jgi:hypothetical protein
VFWAPRAKIFFGIFGVVIFALHHTLEGWVDKGEGTWNGNIALNLCFVSGQICHVIFKRKRRWA